MNPVYLRHLFQNFSTTQQIKNGRIKIDYLSFLVPDPISGKHFVQLVTETFYLSFYV